MSVSFFPAGHQTLDDPNFHNAGAAALLDLLGYPAEHGDMSSSEDADVFLGRALIASALVETASADTEGLPAHAEGRTLHCGRGPGYLDDRLAELVELGLRAQRLGVRVCWG